jgi:ComF family protein
VCLSCWREIEETPAHPSLGRAIASMTVLGRYEGRLAGIVRGLKFHALPRAGTLLGDRLARRILARPARVDLVVPVPLHWRRRWARGYNQAEVIGRPIARALGRPLRRRALARVRFTPSQTGRDRRGRAANVRRAFAARRAVVVGKSILLVDDVITTGATVRECARILMRSGAAAVHVAAAAHTPARETQ